MKLTDSQKLDKLLQLIDLLNMEIKGLRKLIIEIEKGITKWITLYKEHLNGYN